MNTSERILNGIKQALTEGESKVNLFEEQAQDVKEASALTGSGLNIGGSLISVQTELIYYKP